MMFIRKKKNSSGSLSVQVIQKIDSKYKVVKTIGCATTQHEIEKLLFKAKQEILKLQAQPQLFVSENDIVVDQAFSLLNNTSIQTVGPEIVFGKIYDYIGFNTIKEDLFRHLVIARLAFPLSKLKTTEYLYRFQGTYIKTDGIYRFLDKLNDKLKHQVEQISFEHTKRVLNGNISVVFYDMTTLYFEASNEMICERLDLVKTGNTNHLRYL